jgi:hypothetical protein
LVQLTDPLRVLAAGFGSLGFAPTTAVDERKEALHEMVRSQLLDEIGRNLNNERDLAVIYGT